MQYKKSIIALSLCSAFAVANTNTNFMAIIDIENTVAQKAGTKEKNITPWVDEGGEYSCSTWTPNVNTIDYGIVFEQSQDCNQDQKRTKDIYTVYNTGAEVYEKTVTEVQTITITNKQDNTGTKNFKENQRVDPWGEWIDDKDGNYDCEIWNPATSTINYGESFTQTRDCKLDQDRYRDIYDVWADGTETYHSTEQESRTISDTESQSAVGTKNYIVTTRNDSWVAWEDVNTHYACNTWNPNVNTIDYGKSFTQTRDCSQDQTRYRNVYDVWADGTETLNTVDVENKTITETESQIAVGTKNFKDNERADPWSNWTDTGSHYDCGTWSPAPSTINYGQSFTQSRNCSQNQSRTRDVYDVWADGSETLNRTETDTQTINENESRSATGSKNYITGTRTGNWSGWSDSGNQYNCSSWSPSASTVNLGSTFEQTQSCKQNQTRTRKIYNVWADGTETVKNTETGSQTINETNKRNTTGTKNYITGTSYGSWSSWTDKNGHYSCGSWSPATSTINYGQSFTQTRSCKQDQTRSRTEYNNWADGSKTVKRTETDTRTINENESKSATGTKNYVTSTAYGSWSGWSDSGGQYSCSSWSPSTSTIEQGVRFTQNQSCKQNQTRSRTVYNVWADGTQTYKSTENQSKTINETNSRTATGTKVVYGTWVKTGSKSTPGCFQTDPKPTWSCKIGESYTQYEDGRGDYGGCLETYWSCQ